MGQAAFPRFRAVADHAVLAEFGDTISDAAHRQVLDLDAVLAVTGFDGFVESVPAYASLLVDFDPLRTDPVRVTQALQAMLTCAPPARPAPVIREVDLCYDADLGPDLAAVAQAAGLSVEAAIAAHLAGDYQVFMYGFAPGYAYLAGVPAALRLPRKPVARRGVAAGSVIIAAAQCLVTTLTMPTGWWIIAASPTQVLRDDPARPFLFDVGDRVRFRRIGRAAFDAARRG
ncbi:allophanate hydrolase subunit 1 [Paracoccaceae bacterium Fryx2]|nr:allophanate hydrolase subunit 1 [Paracoccaceae bacterium Fryx2]